jgi:transposase
LIIFFQKKIISKKSITFAKKYHTMTCTCADIIKKFEHQLAMQSQLIDSLLAQVAFLEEENAFLKKRNAFLEDENSLLKSKLVEFEKKLSVYLIRKDSSNSSLPPSKDLIPVKRTSSLRVKSGLKPGGQPGHDGSFLEISATPDQTVIHIPNHCTNCNNDLSSVSSEFINKRQVIDIPLVKPFVTEHHIHGKVCSCGHYVRGEYPVEAHSPVCYGSNIQSLTVYLHSRQYIPYARMQEFFGDIFSLPISSGSLASMVESFACKSKIIYEEIRRRVSVSPVVGADETGCRVNGKNKWAWVFQTPDATYIHAGDSRGKKAIDDVFPDGFPKSVLVHDCWRSYFNVQTKEHQICTSHLLRELKYFDKIYTHQQWSFDFTSMLHRALELKRELEVRGVGYIYNCDFVEERLLLEKDLDALLSMDVNAEHKKMLAFKERIVNYRDHLFTFLYNCKTPPDNNASERAIRTYKVKQKVSGQFRAESGAKSFAMIRSVIDTTIKNAQNVWQALKLIACTPVAPVAIIPVAIIDDS